MGRKTILAAALLAAVAVAVLFAFAADGSDADSGTSGSCGDNLTWTFDEGTGTLTITGTGDMTDYTSSGAPWRGFRITSVSLPDGLTSIGKFAFRDCTSLTSVTVPESVTSIGEYAFLNCTSLASVTIPASITSIDTYAFYKCTGVISFNASANNPNFVSSGGVLFSKDMTMLLYYPAASDVTEYVIPDTVATIGNCAFHGCTHLTSVTIPDSVTSIGDLAFEKCTSLVSVTIPDSVTSIGEDVFYGCTSLTSVTLPGSATSIEWGMFDGCTSLASVTIPAGVTSIRDYAFRGCTSLTSITLPVGVSSIGSDTFRGCTSLATVTYYCASALTFEMGSTSNGYVAYKATSLVPIHSYTASFDWADDGSTCTVNIGCVDDDFEDSLQGNVTSSVHIQPTVDTMGTTRYSVSGTYEGLEYSSTKDVQDIPCLIGEPCGDNLIWAFNNSNGELSIAGTGAMWDYNSYASIPWYQYRDDIAALSLPDGLTKIGDLAFPECVHLTSVTVPASVTSIGDYAFARCTSLASVTIPAGVTSIGRQAFQECASLETVTISAGVTSIGLYVFYGCTSLTSIDVSASNPSYTSVGGVLFSKDMTELIQYPAGKDVAEYAIPSGVTSLSGGAFYGCSSLESVTIPDGVTSIGYNAFQGSTSLESVTIPDGVTSIMDYTFDGCTSLTSIMIPASVTDIGDFVFRGCTGMESVNVSADNPNYASLDGVLFNKAMTYLLSYPAGKSAVSYVIPNSIVVINGYAFEGCTSLTSVTIPDRVRTIGYYAFYGCTSLTSVTIPDGVDSIYGYAFKDCTSLTSVTIPAGETMIDFSVFQGCTALESVTIPDGITNIKNGAFSGCTSLASVTIPASVTSIGYDAFEGCTSLATVRYSCASPLTFEKGSTSNGYVAYYATSLVAIHDYSASYDWADDGSSCTVNIGCEGCDFEDSLQGNVTSSVHIQPTVDTMGTTRYSVSGTYEGLEYSSTKDVQDIPCLIGGSCGTDLTWTFNEGTGELVITGTGDMEVYNSHVGVPWYQYRDDITALSLPDGLTKIGGNAFFECASLTSVTIPSSVTSIGGYAMYYCTSLASVTIPSSVTSIGTGAFAGCSSLASVTIPSSVTSIGTGAFYACTSMVSISVSADNPNYASSGGVLFSKDMTQLLCYPAGNDATGYTIPDTVTLVGDYAFSRCASLTSLTIPSSVTSLGDFAISNCTSLTSLTIPSSVTSIGTGAFDGCTSLASVTIPSSLTSIATGAFYSCTSLASVTIPASVIVISSQAFYGCSSLTSLIIPSSVTSIATGAFAGCTSLATVTYSCASSLTFEIGSDSNGGVARYAQSLVVTHDYSASYDWADDGRSCTVYLTCASNHNHDTFFSAEIGSRVKIPATCGSAGTTTYFVSGTYGGLVLSSEKDVQDIAALGHAYSASFDWEEDGSACTVTIACANDHDHDVSMPAEVTSVILSSPTYSSEGVTRYSVSGTYAGLQYSDHLDVADIPRIPTSGSCGADLTWAFDAETGVLSIAGTGAMTDYDRVSDVPWYDYPVRSLSLPDGLTSIGKNAFSSCIDLLSVTIPSNVVSIGDDAFYGCVRMFEVINLSALPLAPMSTDYGFATFYARNLFDSADDATLSTLDGEYIYGVSEGVTYLVRYIGNRDSLILPDSINGGNYCIESSAFVGCTSLTSVTIPSAATEFGNGAFLGCSNLVSVTIPEGITNIESVTFSECTSLTSVNIPDGVIAIGNRAFYGCTSLESVTIPASVTAIYSFAFEGCTSLATVRYSCASPLTFVKESDSNGHVAYYAESLVPIHVYSASYVWSDDGHSCTVTIQCACHDNDMAFAGEVTSSVLTPATLTTDGTTRYSVSGTYDGFPYSSTKDVQDIPATSGICGDSLSWVFDVETRTLSTIGTGAMRDYSNVDPAPWKDFGVRSVSLSEGQTYIGSYAFDGCADIITLTVPGTVTGIGEGAFAGCYRLFEIINFSDLGIASGDADNNGGIGRYAVNVFGSPREATVGMTDSGFVYGSSEERNYLITRFGDGEFPSLPETINGGSYEILAYAFCGNTSVTSVAIPDGVTAIGASAFSGCTSLISLEIPGSVASIGDNAFDGCDSLATVRYSCGSPLTFEIGSEANGRVAYYAASLVEEHVYTASYVWADDGSTCTVNITCARCQESIASLPGEVTSSVIVPATFSSPGTTRYSVSGTYEGFPYSGTKDVQDIPCLIGGPCGTDVVWIIDEDTGALTISGTGEMTNFPNRQNVPWNGYTVRTVTVSDGVTSIGSNAFNGCAYLTSVTMADTVTRIGYYAFNGCASLGSVTVPSGTVTVYDNAFQGCTALTSVTISEGVSRIGPMAFAECTSLTSITIPASVTEIADYAFAGCAAMGSITVSDGNPNYASSGGVLFSKDLTRLIQYPAGNVAASYTIPDTVISIGGNAFYGCDSLTTLRIPVSMTSLDADAFNGFTTVETFVVSYGNPVYASSNGVLFSSDMSRLIRYPAGNAAASYSIPSGVTAIGDGAFRGSGNLTSVTFPDGLLSIGDGAFMWSAVTAAEFPDTLVSIGGTAFYGCGSLASVTIPASVTSIGNNAFLMSTNLTTVRYYCDSPLTFESGSLSNGAVAAHAVTVVAIHDYSASYGWSVDGHTCTVTLTCARDQDHRISFDADVQSSVLNPATYESPGTTRYTVSGTYEGVGYSSAKDVQDIPRITSGSFGNGVTWSFDESSGQLLFSGNGAIPDFASASEVPWKSFRFGSVSLQGITSIGDRAFYDCSYLTSVTVPDTVTSIGRAAFSGCSSLESVTIPSSVTSVGGYVFYGCEALTGIIIPATVTSVPEGAFIGCTALASITLSQNLTYIGESAFSGCISLASVMLPSGLTHIGPEAFIRCTSLRSVVIPATVTGIDGYTFSGCTSLESVSIPSSVSVIGNSAFYGCTSLSSISIPSSVAVIGNSAFYGCTSLATVTYSCRSPLSFDINSESNGYVAYYATSLLALHQYSATYAWSDDGQSCTVNLSCALDHNHDMSFAGGVTSSVLTPATYSANGVTRYTVSGTYDGFDYLDTKDVADILYQPRLESGVSVYEESVPSGTAADLTDLFASAKVSGGKVEVSSATNVGGLTISFDTNAVDNIGGSDVSLSVTAATASNQATGAVMIIEINLDGAVFSGGTATLTLDFDREIPAGKTAKVYFVNGNEREDMNAVFANGKMTFTTSHFSTYEVVFEDAKDPAKDPDSGSGKGGFPIWIAVAGGVAALALVGAAVFLIRRRA